MSYTVSIFQQLATKYTTWPELQAYLSSEEGGSIRIVGEGRYVILRYVKGKSNMEDSTVRWMRSVVWDTTTNRPVCVAPPKAEKGDIPTGEGIYRIEDFLEGTMINVYRCLGDTGVSVCTRSQVGATTTFYSDKSFYTLFEEALDTTGFTLDRLKDALATTVEKPAVFASFLLQHPEHRIVGRCSVPIVNIIHIGSVDETGLVEICEDSAAFPNCLKSFAIPKYPVTGFRSEKDLATYFGSLAAGKAWFFWQGLVAKDGRGRRWRMRYPNYVYLRELRGGEASAADRFLRLRKESKVTEYLRYYAEERDTFWGLETRLRERTQDVFAAYGEVHKARTKKLADLEKAVQPFVYRLHAHYLEHLRPEGKAITKNDVVDLVNNAAPFEQRRLLVA